jgi:hypothetical protein
MLSLPHHLEKVPEMKTLIPALLALALAAPTFAQTNTEILLPQFIQGINGTNNNRNPLAYALTISGLAPNSTYRFFNQVTTSGEVLTANGAGNVIFPNTSGNFTQSSSPSMATAGAYGEFTTDGSGSVTRWFITEPTGNATRFVPGTQLSMNIMLNNGAGGTAVTSRTRTANFITVRNFGTAAGDLSGLYPDANYPAYTPKNIVVAYDNVAGSGRPLAATYIEDDGLAAGSTYALYYRTLVDAQAGRFGLAVPNGTSVRRIEVRSLVDPNQILNSATRADGIWGAVDTSALNSSTTGTAFAPTSPTRVEEWLKH